jgi:hypothetical protein
VARITGNGLHHDLAVIDRGLLHQLSAAMIGSVGDPHLQCVDRHGVVAFADGELEWAEAGKLKCRPAKIADTPERFFQAVRHSLGDQRRNPDRRAVGEIVAVDHSEIDPAGATIGDYINCAVEIERDAEGAREAVGGTERQHAKDGGGPDEEIDRRGQRTIATPDDHHRRATFDGFPHRVTKLLGITYRMRLVDRYASGAELFRRLAENLPADTRSRVDDQGGRSRQGDGAGRILCHIGLNAASVISGATLIARLAKCRSKCRPAAPALPHIHVTT